MRFPSDVLLHMVLPGWMTQDYSTRRGGFHVSFQFCSCILDDDVKFLIIRSNAINSSQSACNVHLGFSLSHRCLASRWYSLDMFDHTSGHMSSDLDVPWIVVSLSHAHRCPSDGGVLRTVNLVNPIQDPDSGRRHRHSKKSSTVCSYNMFKNRVNVSNNVHVIQRNKKRFFSRHEKSW